MKGGPEVWPPWNDCYLVELISILKSGEQQRMSGLVIRRKLLFFFAKRKAPPLSPPPDLVTSLFELSKGNRFQILTSG